MPRRNYRPGQRRRRFVGYGHEWEKEMYRMLGQPPPWGGVADDWAATSGHRAVCVPPGVGVRPRGEKSARTET